METFADAYISCALWASTNDEGESLDSLYDRSDLASETLKKMLDDCSDFEQANSALLEEWYSTGKETAGRAGHDFWLTRNRHGAGFWDRWSGGTVGGALGQQLTDAAHIYGSCDLYVGDDGLIYCQ